MLCWNIDSIRMECIWDSDIRNFITRRQIYKNHYTLYIYVNKDSKILIYSFVLRSSSIHGIKLKHNIIKDICSNNSMAVLNLKNEKDSVISNFAQYKIKYLPKINIEIYVLDKKEKHDNLELKQNSITIH